MTAKPGVGLIRVAVAYSPAKNEFSSRFSGDLQHAVNQLSQIEEGADFANLEQDLTGARERAAEAAVILGEAERNAGAYDVRATERGIANIDARQTAASGANRRL